MNKGESRSKAEFDILQKIADERNKRGWSEYELAEKCGISQSTFTTWRNRGVEPGLASIEKVCKGLGISLSQFFGDSDNCFTKEQKEIFDLWSKLSPDQRKTVTDLIKSFSKQ